MATWLMDTNGVYYSDETDADGDCTNQYARDTNGRISALETDNHALMGNGRPGRVSRLEESIDGLKQWRWKMAGVYTVVSAACSLVIELVVSRSK